MKTTQNKNQAATKKTYVAPQVEKVALDNEISMVMMSLPPTELPQHRATVEIDITFEDS